MTTPTRLRIVAPDDIRRRPSPVGPVSAFVRMVRLYNECDHQGFTGAVDELNRFVAPMGLTVRIARRRERRGA